MIVPAPQLTGTLGPGWEWKQSITFLHPSGQGNVIFSSEPVESTMDTEAYAMAQGDQLREFVGYDEQGAGAARVFGLEGGYRRRFTWAPLEGPTVAQIQCYLVKDGRGYTATATVSLAHVELEPDLLETLNSLRIGQ